jgi:hypothetical protein
MRTTIATDDKQLWRIADHVDGLDYSWPLYATPVRDCSDNEAYLVTLAIPVQDQRQRAFVYDRLTARAFDSDGPQWLIRQSWFEKIAVKCRGITPEYYHKWGQQPELPTDNISTPEPDPDPVKAEDFVRYVCNLAGQTDVPAMNLLYNMFCYNAVKWLLQEQKPLNLGFATLYAIPYRANWRGMLHARWPNIAALFRKKAADRDAALEAIGFTTCLYSTELVEMQTDQTIGWTLEVVPTKSWDKEVLRTETETASKSPTPSSYLYRWSRMIKKRHDHIVHLFAAWLEKASRPLGHLDQDPGGNNPRLVVRRSRGRVRPVAPPFPPTYFTTAPHSAKDEPATAPITDVATAAGVQDLPDADFVVDMRPNRGVPPVQRRD